ncbi:type IV pilus biogenesis protein PilP [Azonexus hydrophilus]|uniref:Type IV pilus biogenesis protein PilP n=1 Tax=Azonexus hydrophilus TaxID=418702 RepID=A0ABZ2XNX2_9RHOO
MFCRKYIAVIVAAVGVMGASATIAHASPAEEIRMLNEQIAVLNARLSKLEVEGKIAQKEADNAKLTGQNAGEVFNTAADAVVRNIEGIDGRLKATLSIRGGVTKTVTVGDSFSGWRVKKITVNDVLLSKGKEQVTLAFGNEPPPSTHPANSLQMPGAYPQMPGMGR